MILRFPSRRGLRWGNFARIGRLHGATASRSNKAQAPQGLPQAQKNCWESHAERGAESKKQKTIGACRVRSTHFAPKGSRLKQKTGWPRSFYLRPAGNLSRVKRSCRRRRFGGILPDSCHLPAFQRFMFSDARALPDC
jgi:hypothetical protein